MPQYMRPKKYVSPLYPLVLRIGHVPRVHVVQSDPPSPDLCDETSINHKSMLFMWKRPVTHQ